MSYIFAFKGLKRYTSYINGVILSMLCSLFLQGQPIVFRHLGVSDGLNAGSISHAVIDKNGFIWIATLDGLFLFDGYGVHQYSKETHPVLTDNFISYLHCDSRNRIWVQTAEGIAMVDENRILHSIKIPGYAKKETIDRRIFEVKGQGIVAISAAGSFISPDGISNWKPYTWLNDLLKNNRAVDIRDFDDNSKLISIRNKKILLVNFKKQEILLDFPLERVLGVCRFNDDEILAGTDGSWRLVRISISQKKIVKQYPPPRSAQGKELLSGLTLMDKAADGNIYIGSRRNGLIRFHPKTEAFYQFVHEPLDKNSIDANGLVWVHCDDAGTIVVTSRNGVNYANINYSVLTYKNYFKIAPGNVINEPVTSLTTDHKGNVFITTSKKLLRWNSKTGTSLVMRDMDNEKNSELYNSVPSVTVFDESGNLWTGYNGDGIIVYNKLGKPIRHLKKELPSEYIRVLRILDNGLMIAGCENGLFMINRKSFVVDSTLLAYPELQALDGKRIVDIVQEKDNIWIAVSPSGGVYQYNLTLKKLKTYTPKNGLVSERVYCLAADSAGVIYAGTRNGLSIIDKKGNITNIDKSSGLKNIRVESIKVDDAGFVWFTNNNNICRLDPRNRKFDYFDEHNGISNVGFTVESSHKSKTGALYFGTSGGFIFFDPKEIKPYQIPLKVIIHRAIGSKNFIRCYKDSTLNFAYNDGKVIFQFSASDIVGNQQIYYRYQLDGVDTGWSEPTHTRSIAYNLKSGKYQFKVQASYDRINYIAGGDTISLHVHKPYWQTWSFRFMMFAALGILLWVLYFFRIKTIKRQSKIQQQLAELEAKAIRAQMNPHFIFNALNAIQELIITEKTDAAYEYLSKFSRLLRLVLNNSEKNTIPLSNELEMIRLYLSLESLRFRQSFDYTIELDKNIDMDEMMVPSIIVQPYIENALWHGLRTKEGTKKLSLRFLAKDDKLQIEVEDNGIGREAAEKIKNNKLGSDKFESKGTLLSEQRIRLLCRQFSVDASIKISDLKNEQGEATGTKVIMEFPHEPGT